MGWSSSIHTVLYGSRLGAGGGRCQRWCGVVKGCGKSRLFMFLEHWPRSVRHRRAGAHGARYRSSVFVVTWLTCGSRLSLTEVGTSRVTALGMGPTVNTRADGPTVTPTKDAWDGTWSGSGMMWDPALSWPSNSWIDALLGSGGTK